MDIPKNRRSFTIVDVPDSKGFFEECRKSFNYEPFSTSFSIIYEIATPEDGEFIREPMAIEHFRIKGYKQTGAQHCRLEGSCKASLNDNSRTRMESLFFVAEYNMETRIGHIYFGR